MPMNCVKARLSKWKLITPFPAIFSYLGQQTFSLYTFLLLIQVETVGDKYMAVSGLPDPCEDHAKCMARVALDMMDMAKNVKMGSNPVVSKVFDFS